MLDEMSTFKDVVVCKFAGCNQVYNDARILPCGKRTCAAHIDEMMIKSDGATRSHTMIKCQFCHKIHSYSNEDNNDKGFPVDENISLLLNMKHGREHDAAKKNFDKVTRVSLIETARCITTYILFISLGLCFFNHHLIEMCIVYTQIDTKLTIQFNFKYA